MQKLNCPTGKGGTWEKLRLLLWGLTLLCPALVKDTKLLEVYRHLQNMNVQGNSVTFDHCSTVDGATMWYLAKKNESAPMYREKREPSGATTAAPPSQPQHWHVTLRTQLWMHLHLHQAPLALWSYARWTFSSSMRDNVKHQQIMAKSCILNTYISYWCRWNFICIYTSAPHDWRVTLRLQLHLEWSFASSSVVL